MIPDISILKLVPSPIDFRDVPMKAATDITKPIPETSELGYELNQKNQGNLPECAGFTGSTIKEQKEHEEGVVKVFDPDWLYRECKKIDGLPWEAGTYFRVVLSVLKNVGCMPMGGDPNALSLIARFRIKGYVQVDCDPDSIKRAIYTYKTVLMGFKGSNGGWAVARIRPPKDGEVVWGHATTGIGYTVEFITGQNSWGEGWGNKGKFEVPLTYMPFECWAVVEDLPDNWQDLIPNPSLQPQYVFLHNLYQGVALVEDVQKLQDCLKYYGCMTQQQIDTGYGTYGPRTVVGVKLFQLRHGIIQTGYFGPVSRAMMNQLLKVA